MVEQNPILTTAVCVSPRDFREMLAGLVCAPGVESTLDLAVTAGAGLSVNVSAGGAFISQRSNGTAPADKEGMYHVYNDATKNISGLTANTTLGIWARVRDADYAGANTDFVLVADTTTLPAGSDSYYKLATVVTGPSSVTSVTDTRTLYTSCGGSAPSQIVSFLTSGTFTPTDYPNLKAIRVRLVAGGGGGGGTVTNDSSHTSEGGGGGAGSYAEKIILASSATLAAPVTVTVGTGGAGGAVGANGSNGTASSFGSAVTSNFGLGGSLGSTQVVPSTSGGGGLGGAVGVGDLVVAGQPGGMGWGLSLSRAMPGEGGSSHMGRGGRKDFSGGSNAGAAGTGYGSGGGGAACVASATQQTGGAGAAGIVIVEIYT